MPVPVYPSDEPRDDSSEHRDPREIIRDIIGGIQTETFTRTPLLH